MLKTQTHTKLEELGLTGFLAGLQEQNNSPELYRAMDFNERFALLVEREAIQRQNETLARRLRSAKLRHNGCMEDVNYKVARGLDKGVMAALSQCQWVTKKQNILITGPTGVGKSYIACALSHRACQDGYRAGYFRASRLYADAIAARQQGKYHSWLASITRLDVLVIDDFGLVKLNDDDRNELLEILEDRHERRSTIVTSQIEIDGWYETIGNPTLADAILDRLVHNAHKLKLDGPTMRKVGKNSTQESKKKTDE